MAAIAQPGEGILQGQVTQAIDDALQVMHCGFVSLAVAVLRIMFEQGAGIVELQGVQVDERIGRQ